MVARRSWVAAPVTMLFHVAFSVLSKTYPIASRDPVLRYVRRKKCGYDDITSRVRLR